MGGFLERFKPKSQPQTKYASSTLSPKLANRWDIPFGHTNEISIEEDDLDHKGDIPFGHTNEISIEEDDLDHKGTTRHRLRIKTSIQEDHSDLIKVNMKRTYYENKDRSGLLITLQHKEPKWEKGNTADREALEEFFIKQLNFDYKKCEKYAELKPQSWDKKIVLKKYYCLLIVISSHGNSEGIHTDEGTKAIHDITKQFSNENLKELKGVPKIFIFDACQVDKEDKGKYVKSTTNPLKKNNDVPPTNDSDCMVVTATTYGRAAYLQDSGSVGLQCVVKTFNLCWKKNDLAEMLDDARIAVALWNSKDENGLRQTMETRTTLLKRLKFVKSKKSMSF